MKMLRLRSISGVVFALWCCALGCSDPSDREQDCTRNEYFDQNEQLCLNCPVVREPSCREGCGFVVISDERGCPAAQCDLSCTLCGEGQRWSQETLSCVSEQCEAGQYYEAQAQACARCPDDVMASTCQGCECSQRQITADERGCAQTTCSQCTTAIDEAHEVVDGQCKLK